MAKIVQNKVLLLFILCNLYTYCGYAQFTSDEDDHLFHGGIIAGTNFSQVDGDYFAGFHKVGWNAGAILYTKLDEQLMVSLEMLYSQKGSRAGQSQVPKRSNDQSTVIMDYSIQLNYAEFPILLNYFDKKKNNIGLGISYCRLLRSKESFVDGSGTKYESDASIYPFKKSDYSLVVNTTGHIWKGLFVNFRYQYSLASVRSLYNPITGRNSQFNNSYATRLLYVF